MDNSIIDINDISNLTAVFWPSWSTLIDIMQWILNIFQMP